MVVVGSYLPGFRGGGPIQSIANLTEVLGSEFRFHVVTSDRDVGSDHAYPAVAGGVWQTSGKCLVRYLGPRETGLVFRRVLRSTPYDVLYLNSFFSPRFTILPLALRKVGAIARTPVIIAPRGEFSPGALSLKATKKRLWLAAARILGLYKDANWHATSEHEADLIKNVMGRKARVSVAPVLAHVSDSDLSQETREDKRSGTARIVFLSRISPKKNLRFAISLISARTGGDTVLDIYGPIDDEDYWGECRRMIDAADDPDVSIRYRGELEHSRVASTLSQYDLFLLPTLGENFGHVILEALAAGCPVAVSDQTPWAEIEKADAGWVIPLGERDRWEAAIQETVDWDEETMQARRVAAKGLAQSRGSSPRNIELNRRLFLTVAAPHPSHDADDDPG